MTESQPKVGVIKTDGINCEEELASAFSLAGGDPKIVHVNDLLSGQDRMGNYQILAIPGGFSYGDDVASGRVLANKLVTSLGDQTNDYINHDGLVLGVCNGFQVLVRSGILPFHEPIETLEDMDVTLTNNESGKFECRWVNLRVEPDNRCVFMEDMKPDVTYQVAHGEGNFAVKSPAVLNRIESTGQVVFRYTDGEGNPTMRYPENPNGSINSIAGITDTSGRILGLMPHPERFVSPTQYPERRRRKIAVPDGLLIFQNMVDYAKGM